jgi:hypothetical protein
MVGWVALSDGLTDHNSKSIGPDFSNSYAASRAIPDRGGFIVGARNVAQA